MLGSLGWYARMIRQTMAQEERIRAAIVLYRNCYCGSICALSDQYHAISKLLSELRAHAQTRYPNYMNYTIA